MTAPAPLVAAGVDLTDFGYMPLDVRRLRDSHLAAAADGEEFRAAVLLWCAAWHQVPAASLADDDVELSQLAGYGRVVKEWQKVRKGALHNWIKCSDGRLYHPVIAEKANEAWAQKQLHAWKRSCDRVRKENIERKKRGEPDLPLPTRPARNSTDSTAEIDAVSGGSDEPSTGSESPCEGIPAENALKGTELNREGKGAENSKQGLNLDSEFGVSSALVANAIKGALRKTEKSKYLFLKTDDTRVPDAQRKWLEHYGTPDIPITWKGKTQGYSVPWEFVR